MYGPHVASLVHVLKQVLVVACGGRAWSNVANLEQALGQRVVVGLVTDENVPPVASLEPALGDAPEVGLVEVEHGPPVGNPEHGLGQARVVGLVKARGLIPGARDLL